MGDELGEAARCYIKENLKHCARYSLSKQWEAIVGFR